MYKFLTNMPIVHRLSFAALLAAVIPGIMIVILGFSYLTTLQTVNATVQESSDAVKLVTDQQADLLRMNALSSALGTNTVNSASQIIQINQEILSLSNDFSQKRAAYQKNYQIVTSDTMKSTRDILNTNGTGNQIPVSQQSMIFVVRLQWQEYLNAQNVVLSDINPQQPASANTLSGDVSKANLLYLPLKGNLDNMVALTESLSQNVVQANAQQTVTLIWGTIIAFLFSTLIVLLIGRVVNQTVAKPLRKLTELTRRISEGETSARATFTGHDEIYMVATSINAMLDNIVHLIQEAQYQRDTLQARVEQLVNEVSGIGEGDLRIQAQVSTDAFGRLANSFNFVIKELSGLVIRVKMMAHNVENLTATSLEHMTQLVEVGDHQIQQITLSEQEVEHMANQTRQVTERARTLYDLALETRRTAEEGRVTMQQASTGIERIYTNVKTTTEKVKSLRESSSQINEIIKVISNVAYQTNRLALDAAVQSAMAGENGKGFAAVASDIRRLAEQTKNQTGIIASLVNNVNENIDNVALSIADTKHETDHETKLVQQTGAALTSIFDAVEQQAKEIESINTMTTQQLQSARAVVQSMRSISRATQESSARTHAASQNMWRLAHLVEQMRVSVEAFKLREDKRYQVAESINGVVSSSIQKSIRLRKI